jgi:uncharacterized protein YprB with RNaseH-like and TPR domain
MITPKLIKNFFKNNTLVDWLNIHRPLKTESDFNFIPKPKLFLDDSTVIKDLYLKNDKYHAIIPFIMDSKKIDDINVKTTNVIIVQYGIGNFYNDKYFKAKCFIYKQLYEENFNEKTCIYIDNGNTKYKPLYISDKDTHQLTQQIELAEKWLELVQNEGKNWSIDEEHPPHPYMMPNISVVDQYSKIKEELAWKWKDVSLLFWIGSKFRETLNAKNIYTLTHPCILENLKDNPQFEVQKEMLKRMFEPISTVEVKWKESCKLPKLAFFDIETSFDQQNKVQVNLVGIFYKDANFEYKFQYFVSKDNSCIEECSKWMKENIADYTIVHYTKADCVAIPSSFTTLDLYDVVRERYLEDEKLLSLHLNNFKLKSVYKNLCKKCGLDNLYDSCGEIKDGLAALKALTQWKESDESKIIEDVISYNKVDCIVLNVLWMYLEDEWDLDFHSYIDKM